METAETNLSAPLSLKERLSVSSKRGLDYYLDHTGLKPEDLEGKTILNLGAGGDDLSDDLKQGYNLNAPVINIDLKYPRKVFWMTSISDVSLTPQNPIKADVAHLPIPEQCADLAFASNSISRWLSKNRQPEAYTEAVRAIKEGGRLYVFELDWQSTKPTDVYLAIKARYPNTEVSYDKKRKTLTVEKLKSYQPFSEKVELPNFKDLYESIESEELKKVLLDFINASLKDVDSSFGERIQYRQFMGALTASEFRDSFRASDNDWKNLERLLVACVDAGGELGNNSVFQRARKLVVKEAIIYPEKFSVNRGDKLLKVAQEFNPDLAATKDKLRALTEAFLMPTWASTNQEQLRWVGEHDPQGWRLATGTLKKNVLSLEDAEKGQVRDYFRGLLLEAKAGGKTAKYKLEIFRVLGNHFKTDEVWSEFTQYNDPSLYGTAEYRSSSAFKGPVTEIKRSFKKTPIYAEVEIFVDSRSDADPTEYAKEIVALLQIPSDKLRNKLVYDQTVRLQICPTCYGYAGGFRAQRLLQETLSGESDENLVYDPKRVDFALSVTKIFGPRFNSMPL